jgi:hypothetical protein
VNQILYTKIKYKGRYGFINQKGEIVIKPIFREAAEFMEGLCPARITGLYGFIDFTGEFMIKPQFDFARSFSDGLALVWIDEIPYFIDKNGNKKFECTGYSDIYDFKNNLCFVITKSEKFGILNKKGELIADTIFKYIDPFKDGITRVKGINDSEKDPITGNRINEIAIMDTAGNFTVPFGVLDQISEYNDGFFAARFANEEDLPAFLIDKNGRKVCAFPDRYFPPRNYFSEGLIAVRAKYFESGKTYTEMDSLNITSSIGYMDSTGNVIFVDSTWKDVFPFSNNRAFVGEQLKMHIVDKLGNFITDKTFDVSEGFQNGYAKVSVFYFKYGVIDTMGKNVLEPIYSEINMNNVTDKGLFITQHKEKWGISDIYGNTIVKHIYNKTGNKFEGNYLYVEEDSIYGYIDITGKYLWNAKIEDQDLILDSLNIDFMMRGYFYAYPETNYMYFPESYNPPKKIGPEFIDKFEEETYNLYISDTEVDTLMQKYFGRGLYLYNTTKDTITLNSQDNRLYMVVQAKDETGKWKDIDYLPRSWCGNSYYTVQLPPNEYWKFIMPVFSGDFKTKLKIKLIPSNKEIVKWKFKEKEGERIEWRLEENADKFIYSDEFDGNINLSQFWRQRSYFPQGLMDPYNE